MSKRQEVITARHVVANASGEIARVAAHVSRALAWQPEPDHDAAFIADLEVAERALDNAGKQLREAVIRVRLAQEMAP